MTHQWDLVKRRVEENVLRVHDNNLKVATGDARPYARARGLR